MAPKHAKPAAPLTELGYVNESTEGWWNLDLEPVPELQWPRSVPLFDAMRKQDAQVASVLRAVTFPVRRANWRIKADGARDEVTEHVADDFGLPIDGAEEERPRRRGRDRFSWPDHLQLAQLELVYGHSYFEQLYRYDADANLHHLRKLAPRLPRTISKINVAHDGGLVSIEQNGPFGTIGRPGDRWATAGPIVIPVNRLVAYINDKEGGNWHGASLLRPAYKHWLIKDRLLRVQAVTIERNGLGVPLYTGADGEEDLARGLEMATGWRSGENSGAAIPFGAMMQLLGVSGTLPDANPAIRYHDEQIARAVLAHFLNLGTQTGSWALGSTFADFFTMSLQSHADHISDVANRHIIEDLVDTNWGVDELAPRLICDEIGSSAGDLARALALLVAHGVIRPDRSLEEFMRRDLTLPPKDTPPPDSSEDVAA